MATVTKERENAVISYRFDEATQTQFFKVKGIDEELAVPTRLIHPGLLPRFTRHGIKQRVSDAAAKPRGTDKNATKATPAEKHAAMKRIVEHLCSGSAEWSPAREEAGPRPLDAILMAAVGEVLGKDADAVRAFIDAGAAKHGVTPEAFLARMGEGKAVQPVVDRMRAAQASDVDPDAEIAALLAEAEGEGETSEGESDEPTA